MPDVIGVGKRYCTGVHGDRKDSCIVSDSHRWFRDWRMEKDDVWKVHCTPGGVHRGRGRGLGGNIG